MTAQTNLDLSLFIAIAALVLSVVGPIASAWINGHYRIKEKNLEFEATEAKRRHDLEQQRKADVIAKYLTTAGRACKWRDTDTLSEFGSAMEEIYLYTDTSLWYLIDEINAALSFHTDLPNGVFKNPLPYLTDLAKLLSMESNGNQADPERCNK